MSAGLLIGVAVWGLFAAAVGRLIAVDTVLERPREELLAMIGRRVRNDAVAEWLVDGLTCPACMAFHVFWVAQLVAGVPGVTSAPWWVLVFAVWGAAQIVLKARG